MVTEVPEKWEEISNFFAVYFNQDFPDDYGTPDQAIQAFKNDAPVAYLHRAATGAEDLAGSVDDEGALRELMFDLGLEYMPWADGWSSAHAWLRYLAELFRG